jgi:alpha-L-fucosidase 2
MYQYHLPVLRGLLFFLLMYPVRITAQSSQKPGDWETLKLKYDQPTDYKNFGAALPLGNGRLGAKVFGSVAAEVLNMNEVTLWSGGPGVKTDPNSPAILAKVRQALAAGQYKKADSLVRFMEGRNSACYEPLGNINLTFAHSATYTNYSRH